MTTKHVRILEGPRALKKQIFNRQRQGCEKDNHGKTCFITPQQTIEVVFTNVCLFDSHELEKDLLTTDIVSKESKTVSL